MTLYISNLAQEMTEEELQEAFQSFGAVVSVKIIRNFSDGTSKGFAFVRMSNEQESDNAMRGLDGATLQGKAVAVSKARTGHDRRNVERRGKDRRKAQAAAWDGPERRRGDRRKGNRRDGDRRRGGREAGRRR